MTSTTATIADLTERTGVAIVTDWEPNFEIPVLTGVQRQGDVIVVPADVTATTDVPAQGTPVVRGESGGNTHAVYADGPVRCDTRAASVRDLTVATLTVPAGSVAYLGHPEHGYLGIGPGSYALRRQREQAEELRVLAD